MLGAMVKMPRLIHKQAMLGEMNTELRFRSELIFEVGSRLWFRISLRFHGLRFIGEGF